jgi:hypothetical protein
VVSESNGHRSPPPSAWAAEDGSMSIAERSVPDTRAWGLRQRRVGVGRGV